MKAMENTKTRNRRDIDTVTPTSLNMDEKINASIIAAAFAGVAVIGLWSIAALVSG